MPSIPESKEYKTFRGSSIDPDLLLPRYKAYQALERKYPESIMIFTDANNASYELYGAARELIHSDLGMVQICLRPNMTCSKLERDSIVAAWIPKDRIEDDLIRLCLLGKSVLLCTINESFYRIDRAKIALSNTETGGTAATTSCIEEETGKLLP